MTTCFKQLYDDDDDDDDDEDSYYYYYWTPKAGPKTLI